MFREDPDRYDDVVNPLRPWCSAAVIFVVAWAAVLADVLDLPIAGRIGRRAGFESYVFLFPFLAVAIYLAFWMLWRAGTGARNSGRGSCAKDSATTPPRPAIDSPGPLRHKPRLHAAGSPDGANIA